MNNLTTIRLQWLKFRARRLYVAIKNEYSCWPCGGLLAEALSSRLYPLKESLKRVTKKINCLDPNANLGNPYE